MRRCAAPSELSRMQEGWCRRAATVVAATLRSSTRQQSAFGEAPDSATAGGAAATATVVRQPHYRRRSSDPRSLRERMDFRRDHKYGRHRPLPDVPWRQHKERTYLDDAERLYGRMETWHTVENEELREKLVAILQDYLRDSIASARLEVRDARKYQRLCETCAKEYRANIAAGAFGSPDMLRGWSRSILALRAGSDAAQSSSAAVSARAGEEAAKEGRSDDGSRALLANREDASGEDAEAEEWRERRRRRGAEAVLDGSAAVADLPEYDTRRAPVSAFPFLRQRAVEGEHTLDPSLVDWTAKYFPADDAGTFREPPQLRQHHHSVGGQGDEHEGIQATAAAGRDEGARAAGSPSEAPPRAGAFGRPPSGFGGEGLPRHHARHRLHRSLRAHEDRHRATFDAEGVFYHVREQSEEDERAPRPKPVRGSEISAPGHTTPTSGGGGVVKVPWGVVSTSKKQGYTPDILRAKERLIRLSRGEDPETIP